MLSAVLFFLCCILGKGNYTLAVSSLFCRCLTGKVSYLAPVILSMSFSPNYDTYATSYDSLDGSPVANYLGIDRMREKAAAYVSGDVTEFGVGTGLESLYYDWGKLKSFVGVDNSSGMLSIARHRLDQSIEVARNGVPINLIQTYAESTPLQSSKVFTFAYYYTFPTFSTTCEAFILPNCRTLFIVLQPP